MSCWTSISDCWNCCGAISGLNTFAHNNDLCIKQPYSVLSIALKTCPRLHYWSSCVQFWHSADAIWKYSIVLLTSFLSELQLPDWVGDPLLTKLKKNKGKWTIWYIHKHSKQHLFLYNLWFYHDFIIDTLENHGHIFWTCTL